MVRSAGPPILDLDRPQEQSDRVQRKLLDTLQEYNQEHRAPRIDNSNLHVEGSILGNVPTTRLSSVYLVLGDFFEKYLRLLRAGY